MKCILCNSRKAKRYCPAKRNDICPVCCGEKRGIEINCPDDCKYFIEGNQYQQQKLTHQRIRKDGAQTYVRRAELYTKSPQLFACIEYALVDAYSSNSSIKNNDVYMALELIMKTLQSEMKGLIFKHRSEDIIVNELADSLEREIRQIMNNPENRVSTSFTCDVIEDFYMEVKFYLDMNNVDSNSSYLIHLSKFHRDRIKPSQNQSGIII